MVHNTDGMGEEINAADPVKMPSYFPPRTHQTASYSEFNQAIRSPHLAPEPPMEKEPLSSGGMMHLHGAEHVGRRRVMNRMVRPDALEEARERYLIPAMQSQLDAARAEALPGMHPRAELVSCMQTTFVQFGAALVGLEGCETPEGVAELQRLFQTLQYGVRIKYALGNHAEIMAAAVAARAEYRARYFQPSLSAARKRRHGQSDGRPITQMDLMAQELDPAWSDEEVACNESLLFLTGAIETGAGIVVHSIDELARWLPAHPEARSRLDDLEFLAAVVMETLRLHPGAPATGRVARDDTTIFEGCAVQAGEWVACMHLPANLDESVFGSDAHIFNPHRELPRSIPRYGTTFGSGAHQCLGLRMVLGNDGVGGHAYVLRMLIDAGTEPDSASPPVLEASEREAYVAYPVIFTKLSAVLP
jgi:cytochrome P450